jgi:cell division protein FtsL
MDAQARIKELESVLAKLEKWFDTDQEVLDRMSMDEIADHARQHGMIRAALRMS